MTDHRVNQITSGPAVELANAILQVCAGHASNVALDALLTNVTWIVADGVLHGVSVDEAVSAITDSLRQAITIQLKEEDHGG